MAASVARKLAKNNSMLWAIPLVIMNQATKQNPMNFNIINSLLQFM